MVCSWEQTTSDGALNEKVLKAQDLAIVEEKDENVAVLGTSAEADTER